MHYRFLFEQMVRRELRQKYKGSALGVLWYLVNPLVLMGAYALVFSVLWRVVDIPDYPLFLIVGLIVWVFFAQAMLAAAPSLVQNAPLVRKVRFPREAIPASVATVQFITFLVMLALVLPVALAVRGSLDPALALLPVIVALLFCLVLGFSMVASVLHAHYRDVEPVLAAALLPWFFLTPIFFRVSDLPGVSDHRWAGDLLQWANPIAPFVSGLRDVIYSGQAPSGGVLLYMGIAGLAALALGVFVFRRMER
ncbi:MAG: ABC transporter permease, partial [Thermoleophilaceae bacterium]|nr:ABC transporter permease [Thermoleophilaceae bacterium]